jgi:hypothetical protein
MASALAPMRESPQFSLVAVVAGVPEAVMVAVGCADGAGLLDEE